MRGGGVVGGDGGEGPVPAPRLEHSPPSKYMNIHCLGEVVGIPVKGLSWE